MFDKSKVITGLYGLVGLRQPTNPDYDILDASNIVSRSGYYSNDNPFCKVEFLVDGIDYISSSDANVNTMIKQMQESAITDVCNAVFSDPDYIDRNLLFRNTINLTNTETLSAGFVGYEIKIADEKNVAFEIPRIICNFKNTGTFKLLLFHSSTPTPIQSKVITITTSHQAVDLGWVVDGSGAYYKGRYYLGFLTNSITGSLLPYKRDYQNSINQSCFSFLDITNVYVPNQTTETIWDLSLNQFSVVENFGINPDITVFYDYTDLILRNEKIFSKAIDLSFQIKIINSYIASLRSNKNERISAELVEKAMLELNGVITANSVLNKVGLIPGLRNEVFVLKKQIDKIKEGYFGNPGMPSLVTLS